MAKLVAIITVTALLIVGGMMVHSSATDMVENATSARTQLLDSIQ